MKRNLKIIISASAASILAFSALAQDATNPKTDGPDHMRDRMPRTRANRLNGAAKSSDIIGMTVKNYQDEKLGKVEDLAIDVESGRIVEIIISTGRSARGYGDSLVAVPPSAFHNDAVQKVLHLDADQAKLKGAPLLDGTRWDEAMQSNRVVEVYTYYGQQPYFVAGNGDFGTINTDGKIIENLPRNQDGTINTDGARTVEKTRNVEIAHSLEQNNDTSLTRNPDGTWNHKYYPNGAGTNCSWSRLG